ncbi:MAG TPA: DUF1003 domain-containing protein [Armatimonadota bacterium]|nr:DUF1003 domain-containing protein [Armatimonadota bacterium]
MDSQGPNGQHGRPPFVSSNPEVADVVRRNIRALIEVRRQSEGQRGTQERVADAITRFTGSLPFVYLHALVFGGWLICNIGLIPGVKPWDPFPFVMLAMIASVEAIFLSTFVLISQNRMQVMADKRADLDLQVNLLAEHEITRLIKLVDAIAEHMGVATGDDPEVEQLKKDVAPEVVLQEIDEVEAETQQKRAA